MEDALLGEEYSGFVVEQCFCTVGCFPNVALGLYKKYTRVYGIYKTTTTTTAAAAAAAAAATVDIHTTIGDRVESNEA